MDLHSFCLLGRRPGPTFPGHPVKHFWSHPPCHFFPSYQQRKPPTTTAKKKASQQTRSLWVSALGGPSLSCPHTVCRAACRQGPVGCPVRFSGPVHSVAGLCYERSPVPQTRKKPEKKPTGPTYALVFGRHRSPCLRAAERGRRRNCCFSCQTIGFSCPGDVFTNFYRPSRVRRLYQLGICRQYLAGRNAPTSCGHARTVKQKNTASSRYRSLFFIIKFYRGGRDVGITHGFFRLSSVSVVPSPVLSKPCRIVPSGIGPQQLGASATEKRSACPCAERNALEVKPAAPGFGASAVGKNGQATKSTTLTRRRRLPVPLHGIPCRSPFVPHCCCAGAGQAPTECKQAIPVQTIETSPGFLPPCPCPVPMSIEPPTFHRKTTLPLLCPELGPRPTDSSIRISLPLQYSPVYCAKE